MAGKAAFLGGLTGLLLIAFSYGAFFEGAAGFGTPVAVTAAILIGLGLSPLAASGLSFAIPQFSVSNYIGPERVDVIAAITSMACLIVFLRVWKPKATKEAAVYTLNLLSATGTGILLAAIIGGLYMKYNPLQLINGYGRTIWRVRYSLLTIVLMLGLSPNLMGAANSSGGAMGKMIDAQSIVVASTATGWFNHEGDILRDVFFHSLALACLVGVYVTLQAYVYPFTLMVIP